MVRPLITYDQIFQKIEVKNFRGYMKKQALGSEEKQLHRLLFEDNEENAALKELS